MGVLGRGGEGGGGGEIGEALSLEMNGVEVDAGRMVDKKTTDASHIGLRHNDDSIMDINSNERVPLKKFRVKNYKI